MKTAIKDMAILKPLRRPGGIGVGHNVKAVGRKPQMISVENTGIHETSNYDAFHMDEKNRPIKEEKVAFFMKQFSKGKNFMKEFPIVVDSEYLILDGQHRFVALKRLELPLYFRYATNLTIDNVVDVQLNAGWHTADFLHAFIKQNIQDYIVLHRFVGRYNLSIGVAASLLTQSNRAALRKMGFYTGTFKIKNEELAHKQAKVIYEIGAMGNDIHRDQKFCMAMVKVLSHPDYDNKRMSEQMRKYGSLLQRQLKTEEYVINLEEIYNYKLYTKNKVRFI